MNLIKTSIILSFVFLNINLSYGQKKSNSEKLEIEKILQNFMECIETKDSLKMYSLFHKGPVTFIGVYKDTTQKERFKKDSTSLNYKISNYKTWFRSVCKPSLKREDFHNIEIIEDGSVASVTFDYSFWNNENKGNWGKEFWHLVNENGNWKIASVIYSIELEMYKPEFQNFKDFDNSESNLVRKMANELLRITNLPGLSVAIRKKDKIVFAEGFGYADLEAKIPVSPTTQFRAASTSKVITATALAKMMQDGIIDIDSSITDYVPYFPNKSQTITPRQLAGHLGGMPHYLTSDKMEPRFYPTVKDAINVFAHHPLVAPPQSKYHYSSHGYVLLSAAMEGASGIRFLDYVQDKVFNPLSMKSSEPELSQYKRMPDMKKLYEQKGDKYIPILNLREMSAFWASAGFVTTPTDLVNMTMAFSNGYFNERTLETIFQSQKLVSGEKTQVGLGWRLSYDMQGREVMEHAGVNQGTRSVICYFPKDELAISVMTNTEWVSSIEETAHVLAQAFLEKNEAKTLTGDYKVQVKIIQKEKVNEYKGTLNFKNGIGNINLENGSSYSIIALTENVYGLITKQGIYYLTLNFKESKLEGGSAIRYQTSLPEPPNNSNPFFIFNIE